MTFLLARLSEDEAVQPAVPPGCCDTTDRPGAPTLQDVRDKQQLVHMYLALPSATPDEVVSREHVRVLLEELAAEYAHHADHRVEWPA